MEHELKQQAGKLLNHVAGYVGFRTIELGMAHGLLAETHKHHEGITSDDLAKNTGLDPFYVSVWAQSAYGAEVLELDENSRYKLAPHIEKLLLDEDFPGHIGGVFKVMLQPEFFDTFSQNFSTGKRLWWNECSPDFIQAVSATGRPFYNRLIPAGIDKVPELNERLEKGANILELCVGAGRGLVKLVQQYPNCTFTGQDGDAHSLELAEKHLKDSGLNSRVLLVNSTLENLKFENEFDMVLINISMHECRDIDKSAKNILRALKPGGTFVISDFPFPEEVSDCRTVPARIMCGIQFFEALIGDQLLPTKTFIELLNKYEFKDVSSADVTPIHAITWGRK